jgi:hypothetical protein
MLIMNSEIGVVLGFCLVASLCSLPIRPNKESLHHTRLLERVPNPIHAYP